MGSGTLNCSLSHLSWVQQVSCEDYLPLMQHNVVWKVRHNVTRCLHGPMQNLMYPIAFRVITGIGVIARQLESEYGRILVLGITLSGMFPHSATRDEMKAMRWMRKGKTQVLRSVNSCCILHACTYRLLTATKTVTWRCLQWQVVGNNRGFCI